MQLNVQARLETGDRPILYRVKHWYETGEMKETSRPEVRPMDPKVYTPMTEAFQWECFDLLFWDCRFGNRTAITADEKRIFNSVFGTATFIANGQGVETHRNYITGERMDYPLPGYMSLVMGGAVLTGTPVTIGGVARLQVAIPRTPVPAASLQPWEKQHATWFVTPEDDLGVWHVNPFPQRGGRNGAPVIVPIFCSVPVTIPMTELELLPPGAPIPNPYIPPF